LSRGKTIGVVIDLPEPHASVIRGWRERVGDPLADIVPAHVTLLPPTSVDDSAMEQVSAQLASVAAGAQPFSMHLSGTGTFRPTSQVVFVQVAAGISRCEELEAQIRRGPLERARDFPFHPHVTVAHDLGDEALDLAYEGLADFVARFRVDRFALFTRDAEHAWIVEREFVLGAL
jgi:2'-5' RNA ligase